MTPISATGIGLLAIAVILAISILISPVYNNRIEAPDWSPNSDWEDQA